VEGSTQIYIYTTFDIQVASSPEGSCVVFNIAAIKYKNINFMKMRKPSDEILILLKKGIRKVFLLFHLFARTL
jgi:hypothetical protein